MFYMYGAEGLGRTTQGHSRGRRRVISGTAALPSTAHVAAMFGVKQMSMLTSQCTISTGDRAPPHAHTVRIASGILAPSLRSRQLSQPKLPAHLTLDSGQSSPADRSMLPGEARE